MHDRRPDGSTTPTAADLALGFPRPTLADPMVAAVARANAGARVELARRRRRQGIAAELHRLARQVGDPADPT